MVTDWCHGSRPVFLVANLRVFTVLESEAAVWVFWGMPCQGSHDPAKSPFLIDGMLHIR